MNTQSVWGVMRYRPGCSGLCLLTRCDFKYQCSRSPLLSLLLEWMLPDLAPSWPPSGQSCPGCSVVALLLHVLLWWGTLVRLQPSPLSLSLASRKHPFWLHRWPRGLWAFSNIFILHVRPNSFQMTHVGLGWREEAQSQEISIIWEKPLRRLGPIPVLNPVPF